MNFSWAEPYPELYKICTLFQMNELSNPLRYCYKSLNGYLQDGPQCGLVALAICSGKPNQETVHNLYEIAKNRDFTKVGEMFSVQNMTDLAKDFLMGSATAEVYDGDLNDEKIRKFILNGGMLLVPYDTNKDNSPGLQKGHKAHWAVISGGILTNDDFYVFARHGKIRNVAVWKLADLAESNKQLFEVEPTPDSKFIIPDGGISGPLGLNKKSVLITPIKKFSE